jgi:predicted nucleic acid-binding protein
MYCIDTSVWIDAWRDYYPPDVFGSLWERMDHLVRAGKVIAPVEVLLELE